MGDLAFLGLCPESFRISLCAGVLCAVHFAKNSQGWGGKVMEIYVCVGYLIG